VRAAGIEAVRSHRQEVRVNPVILVIGRKESTVAQMTLVEFIIPLKQEQMEMREQGHVQATSVVMALGTLRVAVADTQQLVRRERQDLDRLKQRRRAEARLALKI